jgi:hypothetical protein
MWNGVMVDVLNCALGCFIALEVQNHSKDRISVQFPIWQSWDRNLGIERGMFSNHTVGILFWLCLFKDSPNLSLWNICWSLFPHSCVNIRGTMCSSFPVLIAQPPWTPQAKLGHVLITHPIRWELHGTHLKMISFCSLVYSVQFELLQNLHG